MHCHASTQTTFMNSEGSIALVGHPNVGKSVIFQQLTGKHATVSNYPGTTVEVMRGESRILSKTIVVDTPGVITFPPVSEDEIVTAQVLLREPLKAIVQVGDAKNLRRSLLLTVQLAEMERPLVLALNMEDEAIQRGVSLNYQLLAEHLTMPVIPTTAIRGQGIDKLTEAIISLSHPHFRINYPAEIEAFLAAFSTRISKTPISPRSLGLAWLSGDSTVNLWLIENTSPEIFHELESLRDDLQLKNIEPLASIIQRSRLEVVETITSSTMVQGKTASNTFAHQLSHLTTHPVWGLPILAIILYGIYWFVGVFGAGILVDFLEENFFDGVLNPWITNLVEGKYSHSFDLRLPGGRIRVMDHGYDLRPCPDPSHRDSLFHGIWGFGRFWLPASPGSFEQPFSFACWG
jgi:ferrous iron transport protein B